MASRRFTLLAFLKSHLETELGVPVFLYELPTLGPDDAAKVVAIVPDDEIPQEGSETPSAHVVTSLPLHLAALANANLEDVSEPELTAEQLLGEVQAAVESAPYPDGLVKELSAGPIRVLARMDGDDGVGSAAQYDYLLARDWGNPDTET